MLNTPLSVEQTNQMRLLLGKRLSAALRSYASIAPMVLHHNRKPFANRTRWNKPRSSVHVSGEGCLLDSPWSANQLRCARFSGADVRPGNVIERRGKIYGVISAQHTTQGRGGAIIQVELRDVDSGCKVNERLRTTEAVEKIFVQEKTLTYSYTDDETGNIVLMDKDCSQLEVPRHLFGESHVYLQDEMEVTVQLYDDRPLSASIPTKVTCTVVEAAEQLKGRGPMPYKRAKLDNGLAILVPPHVAPGEKIVINTRENSYVSRV